MLEIKSDECYLLGKNLEKGENLAFHRTRLYPS